MTDKLQTPISRCSHLALSTALPPVLSCTRWPARWPCSPVLMQCLAILCCLLSLCSFSHSQQVLFTQDSSLLIMPSGATICHSLPVSGETSWLHCLSSAAVWHSHRIGSLSFLLPITLPPLHWLSVESRPAGSCRPWFRSVQFWLLNFDSVGDICDYKYHPSKDFTWHALLVPMLM